MKFKSIMMSLCIASAIFSSCSSSYEPKEITPTSTEFTSGELSKLIEIVDEPCQLSFAIREGAIETQYIKLKAKLRLIKESPELQKVDAQDIGFTGLLSVAIVKLVDETETEVIELDVKSEDMLKLKKLLQQEEDTEETIVFEGEFHNSDDAPKWFESAKQFTPYLAGDVTVKTTDNSSATASTSTASEDKETAFKESREDSHESNIAKVSSSDIDELLDLYDEYMTQYIDYLKKASKGDLSALSEYPSLLKKAEEYGKKLQECQGSMSMSQVGKFTKIQTRLLNAAQEIKE